MCPDWDGALSSPVDITEVMRFERVELNVNSDPKKYATAHLSMFRWSGVREGGFHFEYQRRFWGEVAEIGVESPDESSTSDSESYPIVKASPESRPSSTTTRRNEGASGAGDSERIPVTVAVWRKGDEGALSPADSLKVFLVLICPSFSILCSNTDHSRFGDGLLKEANIAPGLVREVLFPLRWGIIGGESIRFTGLERVGRGRSSRSMGVPKVWVLPLEPMEHDVDASGGW